MIPVKNVIKKTKNMAEIINPYYDMTFLNMMEIYNAYSKQPFDLICSSFKFGYLQGMKAARAEIERGGRKNEK